MMYENVGIADEFTLLNRQREAFKKQFLSIQKNYETKIQELSILQELSSTLRSTNFQDKQTFFLAQLHIIKEYISLESISLMLLREDQETLELVAESNMANPILNPPLFRLGDGAICKAVMQALPVKIDDIRTDALYQEHWYPKRGCLLCIPVMHGKKALGVLNIHHSRPEAFDQNKIRFFNLITDQIATAIILFRFYQQMLVEEKHRFHLSRFFSSSVVNKILSSDGHIKLGGKRKKVAILFADLRGFTSMSELLKQDKVVKILNAYFSLMTPIIFKHEGTLDKLMGDGILALFGAPLSHKDDTLKAVCASIEMLRALEAFNKKMHSKKWPKLKVSIGINVGDVVAGYIGSEEHLNYTVIGDAVNAAQRIQSIAGANEIFISKAVRDEIHDRTGEIEGLKSLVLLPEKKVKGKEKPLKVYKIEI